MIPMSMDLDRHPLSWIIPRRIIIQPGSNGTSTVKYICYNTIPDTGNSILIYYILHGFLVTIVLLLFLVCFASVGDCAEKVLGIEIYNCFAYRRMRVRSCVCCERIR